MSLGSATGQTPSASATGRSFRRSRGDDPCDDPGGWSSTVWNEHARRRSVVSAGFDRWNGAGFEASAFLFFVLFALVRSLSMRKLISF